MFAVGALPFIAIILLARSHGLYQIEGRRNDARPSLAGAFIFPSCILAFRAIQDLHFLEWKPLVLASLAFAAVRPFSLAHPFPIFPIPQFPPFPYFSSGPPPPYPPFPPSP